ncbi:DUF1638 domain-containing protein [Crassaminicella profunda]|uniref:DUF1638 domain-containing protein n=1 Tax=Crassaminicella profunda TaxID=1286698 RepID=UPI001FEAD091|nr:DUF1638 domain-containing protein [Crassaminicella profunda]
MSSDYHEYPKDMHKILQQKIDELEKVKDQYDYILLGFGLCGNVLEDLESRSIPIVAPRAHDCITLFMGSKETYEKYFKENTGTMYYIESWIDRNGLKKERKELESIGMNNSYEEYVEKYGEENAKYLIQMADEWKSRYNKALYISSELKHKDFSKEVKELAEERNWDYEERKNNCDLIKKMVNGEWQENKFLIVDQHSKIYHTTDSKLIDFKDNKDF